MPMSKLIIPTKNSLVLKHLRTLSLRTSYILFNIKYVTLLRENVGKHKGLVPGYGGIVSCPKYQQPTKSLFGLNNHQATQNLFSRVQNSSPQL